MITATRQPGSRGGGVFMELLSNYTCDANYAVTGATTTAWVFLGIFVALIVGDGALTGYALRRAIHPHPLCC